MKSINYLDNKIDIVNTIKMLIYKENPDILEKIDFDNDNIFLDPLIFAYFNSKKDNLFQKEMLLEILQGYFNQQDKEIIIKLSYNENGYAYIPKIGYYNKNNPDFFENILEIDTFEIVKEVHPVLERYFVEAKGGHIINANPIYTTKWKETENELLFAINLIREFLPLFYNQLIFANKKIFIHDNPNILNFTSVETLGMLFFYSFKKDNIVYFIEELIHQGSHNFLYFIVHNREEYFKIDVDNLIMKDFTGQTWDYRNIYGAFHGLYTVTKRLECFDELLIKNVFNGKQKHELLARLSDQFARLRTGLQLLELNNIYTAKGLEFYSELDSKSQIILKKYKKLLSIFDLSKSEGEFRYDKFEKLNSFDEFLIKDKNGVFNF